jgi:hypothetical protein
LRLATLFVMASLDRRKLGIDSKLYAATQTAACIQNALPCVFGKTWLTLRIHEASSINACTNAVQFAVVIFLANTTLPSGKCTTSPVTLPVASRVNTAIEGSPSTKKDSSLAALNGTAVSSPVAWS